MYIMATNITVALRASAALIGSSLGFLPSDVSARSLRAGGAMALLCAHVDTDRIPLIDRWQSDKILWYLHLQAQPVMQDLACHMLVGGTYTLIPGQDIPNAYSLLISSVHFLQVNGSPQGGNRCQ